MGVRKIIWNEKAVKNFTTVFCWYREERGEVFARKFFEEMMDTIDTLAQMPNIGRVDEHSSTSQTVYNSFLAHPKYRIVYRFNKETIYIVNIRATMMNH